MMNKIDKHTKIIYLTTTNNNRLQYILDVKNKLESLGYINQEIYYGVDIPLQAKIAKDVLKYATCNIDHYDQFYIKQNVFNCVLNHYMIIKKYYELGYDNIIVIEDDCQIKNLDLLASILENIPDDTDIARLSVDNCLYNKLNKKIDKYFYRQHEHKEYYSWFYGSTLFNIYFRNGMKFYIDYIDNNGYIPADHPLMNTCGLNHYIIYAPYSPVINLSLSGQLYSITNN